VKALDRHLQRRRIAVASRWVPAGARVLDVGCADGSLLRSVCAAGGSGVGLDPVVPTSWVGGACELRIGLFPDAIHVDDGPFDVITALAVFEHVEPHDHRRWVEACRDLLAPAGRLIITVPSAAVDPILDVLRAVRLVDGMALKEHHGFRARDTSGIFTGEWFTVRHHRRFQLGLNNLYVIERTGTTATSVPAGDRGVGSGSPRRPPERS
jgi:SAM-dependent methyltransferase